LRLIRLNGSGFGARPGTRGGAVSGLAHNKQSSLPKN
jgi:hypothetical protein